jgi:hypothetical protein
MATAALWAPLIDTEADSWEPFDRATRPHLAQIFAQPPFFRIGLAGIVMLHAFGHFCFRGAQAGKRLRSASSTQTWHFALRRRKMLWG